MKKVSELIQEAISLFPDCNDEPHRIALEAYEECLAIAVSQEEMLGKPQPITNLQVGWEPGAVIIVIGIATMKLPAYSAENLIKALTNAIDQVKENKEMSSDGPEPKFSH